MLASDERSPWLRGPRFDFIFILGLVATAVATGLVIVRRPDFFLPILAFDLWFLGYHHVISTYTRLCFDRKSFSEHRSLLVFLPIPVLAVTMAAYFVLGLWSIISVYFYWQWFHYTRQSWGVSRAYRSKDRGALFEDGWLDQAIFYALPVLGILHRSYQNPGRFIGLEIRVFPVPFAAVVAAGTVTALLLGYWTVRRIKAWRQGRLAVVHTAYMLSHFLIFSVGYLLISDVTFGWLAINIWHNAQYILFVWLFNTRRFAGGVAPEARLISYISQPRRLWLYLSTCLLITGIFYLGVIGTIDWLFFAGVSSTLVLYQVLNFHHYLVDSKIWRRPGAQAPRPVALPA